jgi:3-hydroxyacyl-[acyl-carrier-protein] dehydratase
MVLEFDQLWDCLPYAQPWLLIDRVLDLEPGKRITALKNISGNEWMFPGHFPGRAIYPGVLLIESIAQAAIVLLKASQVSMEGTLLLAGVRARFLRTVIPGDQILITCHVDKVVSNAAVITAEVATKDAKVAHATVTFAARTHLPASEDVGAKNGFCETPDR